MAAPSIIDEARVALNEALNRGLRSDDLERAIVLIGSTAFREEFIYRASVLNDPAERIRMLDDWRALARTCRQQWDRKDFGRQTLIALGISGGGSAVVAALVAAANPASAPLLALAMLIGAGGAARSYFGGQSLTDEMSLLGQIADAISATLEDTK
ncbi:hypothetical protein [Blastomonas sp.]|uniref:hypothetical protein n=1 Tax=Blastomonas sp. TaxID=1909299 RepID=UPI003593D02D